MAAAIAAGSSLPRIVAGDHDAIGEGRRHAAHLRPLAGIAIAAATEHAHEAPPLRDRGTHRREHLLQRVGRMRVIDHDQRRASSAQPLHAAGRRREPAQRVERRLQRHPAREQHAERAEQVERVERAGEPDLDLAAAPGRGERERHPAPVVRIAVTCRSAPSSA